MIDFAGTVLTLALIVFIAAAAVSVMDLSRTAKLVLAGVLGLWVGLAAAGAADGWFALPRQVPPIGFFVVVPLIAAGLFAATATGGRTLLSLPLSLLVGLNIGRVFAVLFLMLAAEGRLSGPFPHSAAWGDIITGALALPLLAWTRDPARHAVALHAWNLFGLADLIAAIGLGITSGAGSPLQLFPAPGSAAMQELPFSFVPTVLVPMWMILHGVIYVQLRRTVSPSLPARG